MNTIEALITIPRTISLNSTFDCNLSLYVISFDAPDETIPSYFVVGKITKFPDCFKNHAQIIFVEHDELSDSLLHRVKRDRCFVLIGRRIGRICEILRTRIGQRPHDWPSFGDMTVTYSFSFIGPVHNARRFSSAFTIRAGADLVPFEEREPQVWSLRNANG